MFRKFRKLEKKVNELENKVNKAVFVRYYNLMGSFYHEISVSKVTEKILEHLNLEFKYEFSKEENHILESIRKEKTLKE